MQTDDDKKTTRSITLPAFMWDRLKELAEKEDRTINAQLRVTLKEALSLTDA